MTPRSSTLLDQFETHELNAETFGHIEHVQVAWEMLHTYPFIDACATYARVINAMAAKAGAPKKFNVTITLAFLSLIAERIHATPGADFEAFLALNADLKSGNVLGQWYSDDDLKSDFARTHFLVPHRKSQSVENFTCT